VREVLFTSLEGIFALRTSFSLLSAPLSHETSACAYPTHSLTYLPLVGGGAVLRAWVSSRKYPLRNSVVEKESGISKTGGYHVQCLAGLEYCSLSCKEVLKTVIISCSLEGFLYLSIGSEQHRSLIDFQHSDPFNRPNLRLQEARLLDVP
jgi:hypothetical protein